MIWLKCAGEKERVNMNMLSKTDAQKSPGGNTMKPLWSPSGLKVKQANMTRFMAYASEKHGQFFEDVRALWQWSVNDTATFWSSIWDFCDVIGDKKGPVLEAGVDMIATTFFPEAKLNLAENLLRRRDDATAIVFWGENKVKRSLTFNDLYLNVARLAKRMRAEGVDVGDRVVGYMPNSPEAIVAMLATASIGAIWSSCSPEVNGSL